MDRLLVLRLESSGLAAEATFNGVPLLRVGAARRVALLSVHEFALAGSNELQLTVLPAPAASTEVAEPEPLLADGTQWASLRLLLPRIGAPADPASARTLAQLDFAPAADTLVMTPHQQLERVALPITFARWRWLDAPPLEVTPALRTELAAWLLDIALGLARGQPEPLLQATRLRLEDTATAYQRPLAADVQRLRTDVQQLHGAQPLKLQLPSAGTLRLRPVADGRLLECLLADGGPALRTQAPEPAGQGAAQRWWPLRVAQVDGRFYGLR